MTENFMKEKTSTMPEAGQSSAPTACYATRPKIITICGSSRFVAESAVKAWELNKQGIATFYMPLLPQWYPDVQEHHQAEHENVAANLDNLWLELIRMSDEIFVVNCAIPGHENGYIGQRTRIEINHALSLGKPVRYMVEHNAPHELPPTKTP
jgi:hypothetical protein